MTIFKRSKSKPQTRIVRHAEPAPKPAPKIAGEVKRVLRTQRWDPVQGDFRGFDSPPGRF